MSASSLAEQHKVITTHIQELSGILPNDDSRHKLFHVCTLFDKFVTSVKDEAAAKFNSLQEVCRLF